MQRLGKASNLSRMRRCIFELGILAIIFFTFGSIYHYYTQYKLSSFDFLETAEPYNEYIDGKAQYLSYSGYKILQHFEDPVSPDFSALVGYLSEQFDFVTYFTIVHYGVHHITLSNLKNRTSITRHQLSVLKEEQELLDQDHTTMTALGKRLYMINGREIRLEIELNDKGFLELYKKYKTRWDEKFGEIIIERPKSFYITLAYQYREIPHQDIHEEVIKILKLWETYPIEINFGPIEIVSYKNMMSYTPVLSDLNVDT